MNRIPFKISFVVFFCTCILLAQVPQKPYFKVGHSTPIYALDFGHTGQFVASTSLNKIVLWNRNTQGILRTMFHQESHYIWDIAFTSDDKYLISASHAGNITIWETRTGKAVKSFLAHESAVRSIAISDDNSYLLSTSEQGEAKIWDFENFELIQTFSAHTSKITHSRLLHTPNGYKAITMSEKELYIWDPMTGNIAHTIDSKEELYSFDLSKDKSRLLVAAQEKQSYEYQFLIQDLTNYTTLHTYNTHKEDYKKIYFIGNKYFAALSDWRGDKRVDIYNNKGEKTNSFKGEYSSLCVDKDTHFMLIGHEDGSIVLMRNNKLLHLYDDNISLINDMVISNDGKALLYATTSKKVYIWDFFTAKQKIFKKHTSSVFDLATGRGGLVASKDTKGTVYIYHRYSFNDSNISIRSDLSRGLHFMDKKSRLKLDLNNLSATDPEALQSINSTLALGGIHTNIFDLDSFSMTQVMKNNKKLTAIHSDTKGRVLVTTDYAKTIKLYHKKKGKFVLTHTWNTKHQPLDAKITPNGKTIAVSFKNDTICTYNTRTQKQTQCFNTSVALSETLGISPDSRYLAYPDINKIVLWDIKNKKLHTKIDHPYGFVQKTLFSPNGKFLFVLGASTITIYENFKKENIKPVMTRASFEDGSWINITPKGIFHASGDKQKNTHTLETKHQARHNDPDVLDDIYFQIWAKH